MKKYKKDFSYSYSIGVYPTLELLSFKPETVIQVIISDKGRRNQGVVKITELCQRYRIHIERTAKALEDLSESENCYAIGVFRKYSSTLKKANHLVLVNPSDKGNLGTIIRTMIAFNFHDLAIIQPAVDLFDPKVIRASMGAAFRVNAAYYRSFQEYQSLFPNHMYPFMTNGKTSFDQAVLETPFSLIFGNEGTGLPQEFRAIGQTLTIPQSQEVDSLNLAVAVGVGLYQSTK